MAKTPHFFKLILEDAIQQGMLRIPKKFVRRYGKYLSEQVSLKLPSGEKWKVELVKHGDGIWLGNGWQHFVDYYSLSLGSFLVFGFEDFKTCTFNVLIFDKTTSEIDYPLHVHKHDDETNLEEQVHQPTSNQEDEDKSPLPFSRPCKKRKRENCRTQSEAKRGNGDKFSKRTQQLTAEEKANALHRASTFCKSDNPSFSIVMHPSYVCAKNKPVTIPASFANKYFSERRGIIILNCVHGKTWTVRYVSYKSPKASRLTMINSGWSKFAEENHLAIGDVCVFELINHNASEFKVVICRKNQDAAKSVPSVGNSKHLKEFPTFNPYFKLKLQPIAILHGHINVPVKFMEKCKNPRMEKAQLQVEGKVWHVKLLSYPYKCAFSAGEVSAFVDDNSLKVGDVCVFELINSETMLIKVSIVRKP
ncbi:B3 domain-containing transcription factor VRN1-like [Euphorbia lathyris]|uniref:B3 domain-containing transcription factor VRN1-like n=1 Tax=Euphorbia lathyris TaxID=212925 RepID=UPI0033140A87